MEVYTPLRLSVWRGYVDNRIGFEHHIWHNLLGSILTNPKSGSPEQYWTPDTGLHAILHDKECPE